MPRRGSTTALSQLRDAWDGRDGVMAEFAMNWDGSFELQEQSYAGQLLHLLVCSVDVDALTRRIDRMRLDGCVDDRALLRRSVKDMATFEMPAGTTLSQVMPAGKLTGGDGVHLKVHR